MKKILALLLPLLILTPTVLASQGLGIARIRDEVTVSASEDSIDYKIGFRQNTNETRTVYYIYEFDRMNQSINKSFELESGELMWLEQTIYIPDKVKKYKESGIYSPDFKVVLPPKEEGFAMTSVEAQFTDLQIDVTAESCDYIDCGPDTYTDWQETCDGDDLIEARDYYNATCVDKSCFNKTVEQTKIVKECSGTCEDEECIQGNNGGSSSPDDENEDDENNGNGTDDNDTIEDGNNTTEGSGDIEEDVKTVDVIENEGLQRLEKLSSDKEEFRQKSKQLGYTDEEIKAFLQKSSKFKVERDGKLFSIINIGLGLLAVFVIVVLYIIISRRRRRVEL